MTLDAALVERLLAAQFPQWAGLAVESVPIDGWDNRTFRVGAALTARLPSGPDYAPQAAKEARWLPVLAGALPLPIPEVVALGLPGDGFPFEWTLRRWIEGVPLREARDVDLDVLAIDLADFLLALRAAPTADGPAAGSHSQHRGGPVRRWDAEVAAAIDRLGPRIDALRARRVWSEAVAAPPSASASWLHGDVAVGNLLTRRGRLSAVIDFGCCAVGDPACDLVLAWTAMPAGPRARFRAAMRVDDAEWRRGAGWALWKSLVSLDDPREHAAAAHALRELGVLAP